MVAKYFGLDPKQFGEQEIREIVRALNEESVKLESGLVKASPSGVSGQLRQSWQVIPASPSSPTAIIGTSSGYFLPVEMGRRPGSGISAEGQESVTLWARRVLGLSQQEGSSLAFLLSRKYKEQGRPAQGFAGLAKEGTIPSGDPGEDIEPLPGGMIEATFSRLSNRLNQIARG